MWQRIVSFLDGGGIKFVVIELCINFVNFWQIERFFCAVQCLAPIHLLSDTIAIHKMVSFWAAGLGDNTPAFEFPCQALFHHTYAEFQPAAAYPIGHQIDMFEAGLI